MASERCCTEYAQSIERGRDASDGHAQSIVGRVVNKEGARAANAEDCGHD